MLIRYPRKRAILVGVCGRYKNWLGRNKALTQTWQILMKDVDLDEPTSFLDHVYFGLYSARVRSQQGCCGQLITEICSNQGFLHGLLKN